MIFDHELFFTKSGSTTLAVTDTEQVSDKISVESFSFKEGTKPAWAFYVFVGVATAPSADTALVVYIRSYYGTSSFSYVDGATGTIATTVSVGEILGLFPALVFPLYPSLNTLNAITDIAVSYKTITAGSTMSITAKLLPFKI